MVTSTFNLKSAVVDFGEGQTFTRPAATVNADAVTIIMPHPTGGSLISSLQEDDSAVRRMHIQSFAELKEQAIQNGWSLFNEWKAAGRETLINPDTVSDVEMNSNDPDNETSSIIFKNHTSVIVAGSTQSVKAALKR